MPLFIRWFFPGWFMFRTDLSVEQCIVLLKQIPETTDVFFLLKWFSRRTPIWIERETLTEVKNSNRYTYSIRSSMTSGVGTGLILANVSGKVYLNANHQIIVEVETNWFWILRPMGYAFMFIAPILGLMMLMWLSKPPLPETAVFMLFWVAIALFFWRLFFVEIFILNRHIHKTLQSKPNR